MNNKYKKYLNFIWLGISILAILGMVAFTLLPIIYYG